MSSHHCHPFIRSLSLLALIGYMSSGPAVADQLPRGPVPAGVNLGPATHIWAAMAPAETGGIPAARTAGDWAGDIPPKKPTRPTIMLAMGRHPEARTEIPSANGDPPPPRASSPPRAEVKPRRC